MKHAIRRSYVPLLGRLARSLNDALSRTQSAVAVAPLLLRYVVAALLGAGSATLAAFDQMRGGGNALLLSYPLVGIIAGFGGLGVGIVASTGAAIGVWSTSPDGGPQSLGENGLFWTTLVLVAAIVGRLSDSLREDRVRAEQERLTANEFAAALHLRLTLAEQEIERLRAGLVAGAGNGGYERNDD